MAAGEGGDGLAQFAVGQGAGGNQHRLAVVNPGDLLPVDGDVGVGLHQLGDRRGKPVPVHRQCTAGRHAGSLGGIQQMGAHLPHFQLEQAGSRVRPLGFQRVGADQLGKTGTFVGRGKTGGLLLVQVHGNAAVRQPQRRLAAGQAGAQDVDLHDGSLSYFFSTGFSKPQPSLAQ